MISLKIQEIKPFMALLFRSEAFDKYYTREVLIKTFTDFSISGKRYHDFYSDDEDKKYEETNFVIWEELREIAFQMIKGKRTPSVIRLIFQLPKEKMEELSSTAPHDIEVDAMFLNIRFENNELFVVSGISKKGFSMDKTMDHMWDDEVKRWLKQQGIVYSEEA